MLTPVADQSPKDRQCVNVPQGLPQLVERFEVGVIPSDCWSNQKSSIVQDKWDASTMDFPCPLDIVLAVQHYSDLCLKTLQTLVKPVNVDPRVMTVLGRHVPQTPPPPR